MCQIYTNVSLTMQKHYTTNYTLKPSLHSGEQPGPLGSGCQVIGYGYHALWTHTHTHIHISHDHRYCTLFSAYTNKHTHARTHARTHACRQIDGWMDGCTLGQLSQAGALPRAGLAQNTGLECELMEDRGRRCRTGLIHYVVQPQD